MYSTPLVQYQIKSEAPPGTFPAIAQFESAWHQPWTEPVRFRRISAALATSGYNNPNVPIEIATQTLESRWHYAWSEPVRLKRGTHPSLQPFIAFINSTVFQLDPRIVRYTPLSEPVRLKKGLGRHLQPTLAMPNRILPVPNVTLVMNATETNSDVFLGAMRALSLGPPVKIRVSIREMDVPSGGLLSIEET